MKNIALVVIIYLISSSFIFAQREGIGVGIILGEPSGVVGNYWLTKTNSVDFGIGGGFLGEYSGISLHSDFLYHIDDIFNWKYRIPFYYGFGARMRFPSNSSFSFGVRGVVGVMLLMKKLPIDIFLEVAPSFRLLPTTGLDIDLAIGGRYYFKDPF